MKYKIYSFVLLLSMIVIFGSASVMAATKEAETTTAETAETTTSAPEIIVVNKKVKVNKTFKVKKALKIKKSALKKYTITTSNAKVATVSEAGIVKGIKKGTCVITLTSKADGSVFAQINVKVKNRYTKAQLRLMSSIIYSEAGAECYAGKKAVGIVIMNRVKSSQFPSTLTGVIYQSGQFGPATNGSLNKSLALYDQGKLNKQCIKAAKATLNGDKFATYQNRTIDMSNYLYFSGYIKGSTLRIQGHEFK